MTAALLQHAQGLQAAGNFREAEAVCAALLREDPQNVEALHLLGMLHLQLGKPDLAEQVLARIPHSDRRFAEAQFYRGIALCQLRRDEDAVACFGEVTTVQPGFAPALLQLGGALSRLGRPRDALLAYDRFLSLEPGSAEAWHWRGNVLCALDRLKDAVESYSQSLALNPNGVETMHKRADALFYLGRFDEASDQLEHLLLIEPKAPYARGRLVFDKLQTCSWSHIDEHRERVLADLRAGFPAVSPGEFIAFSDSPSDQLQCARIWTAHQCPAASAPLWRGEPHRHDRIRVAYLSKDFRFHPVTAQLVGVIETHDKSRFETIGISFGQNDQTEMCARLCGAFERFAVVEAFGDTDVAALLRRHEVDIAIDLMGHTGGSRPGIFALRPAPVQVNFLGFPGTTGAEYMDYIVADPIVIPPEDQRFYSERVAYLPETYFPTDARRQIAGKTPNRSDAGLPEQGFVFCSFNNSFKYSPALFDVWMALLRNVAGSVLWLPESNAAAIGNLRGQAKARGIGAERLVCAPFVPNPADHLARLKLADLFLDTLPYNAHSSACDALWAGVPVVTCRGGTFAGRVAASVLTALGLPELVAPALKDYEALALELARDPALLSQAKRKLVSNRATHPLFDTERFTRHLEAAYRIMWQRSQQGLPPQSFVVSARG
jgi:predicted O-linked N-acetylglucosamine transferase (SPINDLY family)